MKKGVQVMTIKEIAKKANCSVSWVYNIAKRLGRLPTVEEITKLKGTVGRPKKYKGE